MLKRPAERQGKRSTGQPRHTEPAGGALSARAEEDAGNSVWTREDTSACGSFFERFCAKFSAALSEALNLPVQISVLSLKRLSYAGFQASTEELACCYELQRARSSGPQGPGRSAETEMCLEICPELAFAMIDRLLGGSQENAFVPSRPPTRIEGRLLRRVASLVADCLSCPGPGGGLGFCLGGQTGPQERQAAGTREQPVLVATFSLRIGRNAGTMRLCVPCGLMGILVRSGPGAGLAEGVAAATTVPGDGKVKAPIEISAAVEGTMITAEELADLGPGDIVSTDTPGGGEVIVRVAGIPKFVGRLSTSNGRRAVIITRRLDQGPGEQV